MKMSQNSNSLLICVVLTISLFTVANAACKIPDCLTCDNQGAANEACTSCKNDTLTFLKQYPTANGGSCQTCAEFITNCTKCTVNKGVAKCQVCEVGQYIDKNGSSCKFCPQLFTNCNDCRIILNGQILGIILKKPVGATVCLGCVNNQYPNSGGDRCQTCGHFINNCKTCSVQLGRARCFECQSGLIPKPIKKQGQVYLGGTNCGRP